MPTRPPRRAPTRSPLPTRLIGLGVLVALVAGLLALTAGAASAVTIVPATSTEQVRACQYEPSDDDLIHIRGCLRDQRQDPPTPVAGVGVTVLDADGEVIEEQETNESGVFDVALEGDPITNLGKDFTVEIDTDTLPEGSGLRDPDKVSVTINFDTTSDQTIVFPIGDPLPEGPSKVVEGIQLLIGGIVFSLLLAMAALGLSLIFGTTGLTNFAHGELITFGALIAWAVDLAPGQISFPGTGWNITIIVAVVVAFLAGSAFGLLNDLMLWRPLRRRGTGLIAMMIVSIGLSILLRSLFQYFADERPHNYSQYSSVEPWRIGQILLTPRDVAVAGVAIVALVAVTSVLRYTRLGKATRAVADNPALAASSGINVQRVIASVWTLGGGLAALSGVLLGITQGFDFQIGFKLLLLVFAATVLGGLGTIWGAIVGALVIGIFVEVSTLIVPAELKYVGALVILILVLLVRPQGLLGRAQRVG